jgi:Sec7-like guanine-nucleotide exchange factor
MKKKMTTEEFVRNVLVNSFKQKIDQETLREVAQKVDEAVTTRPLKADRPRRAA